MSKFHTTEVSDPRFEINNLKFITVKSSHLGGRGDILVYAPPSYADIALPVVILLHGVYGSCWSWAFQAGVHVQVQKCVLEGKLPPMILAMPSDGLWGDGSGYLAHSNRNFEAWIIEDVVTALHENVRGATADSPLFITGLSMGGLGALRIGAKYGNRFSGISGHSSITHLAQMELFVEEPLADYGYGPIELTDYDVFETIRSHRDTMPPMRFDCGKDDLLIEANRKLHEQLVQIGVEHQYQEFEGKHEWAYWERYVRESLLFFANQLKG